MSKITNEILFLIVEIILWLFFGLFNPNNLLSSRYPGLNFWSGAFAIPLLDLTDVLLETRSSVAAFVAFRIRELVFTDIQIHLRLRKQGLLLDLTASTVSLWVDLVNSTQSTHDLLTCQVDGSGGKGTYSGSAEEKANNVIQPLIHRLQNILDLLASWGVHVRMNVGSLGMSLGVVDDFSQLHEHVTGDTSNALPLLHLGMSGACISSTNNSGASSIDICGQILVISVPGVHDPHTYGTTSSSSSSSSSSAAVASSTSESNALLYSDLCGSSACKADEREKRKRGLSPLICVNNFNASICGLMMTHDEKKGAEGGNSGIACSMHVATVLEAIRVYVDMDDTDHRLHIAAIRDVIARILMALDRSCASRPSDMWRQLLQRITAFESYAENEKLANLIDYFYYHVGASDTSIGTFEYFDAASLEEAEANEISTSIFYPNMVDWAVEINVKTTTVWTRWHGQYTDTVVELSEMLVLSGFAVTSLGNAGIMHTTLLLQDVLQKIEVSGSGSGGSGCSGTTTGTKVGKLQSCCVAQYVGEAEADAAMTTESSNCTGNGAEMRSAKQDKAFINITMTDRYTCEPLSFYSAARLSTASCSTTSSSSSTDKSCSISGVISPIILQVHMDDLDQISYLAAEIARAFNVIHGSSVHNLIELVNRVPLTINSGSSCKKASITAPATGIEAYLLGLYVGKVNLDVSAGEVRFLLSPPTRQRQCSASGDEDKDTDEKAVAEDAVIQVATSPFRIGTSVEHDWNIRKHFMHMDFLSVSNVNSSTGEAKLLIQITELFMCGSSVHEYDATSPIEATARCASVDSLLRSMQAFKDVGPTEASYLLYSHFHPRNNPQLSSTKITIDSIVVTLKPSDLKLLSMFKTHPNNQIQEQAEFLNQRHKAEEPSWEPIGLVTMSRALDAKHTSLELGRFSLELLFSDIENDGNLPKAPFLELPHSLTITRAPTPATMLSLESFSIAGGLLASSAASFRGDIDVTLHSRKFSKKIVPITPTTTPNPTSTSPTSTAAATASDVSGKGGSLPKFPLSDTSDFIIGSYSSENTPAASLMAVGAGDGDGDGDGDQKWAKLPKGKELLVFEGMSSLRIAFIQFSQSGSSAALGGCNDASSAFYALKLPAQLFSGKIAAKGIVLASMVSFTTVRIPSIACDLDAYNIRAINICLANLDEPELPYAYPAAPMNTPPKRNKLSPTPTSLFSLHIERIHVGLTNELDRRGICSLGANSIDFSKIAFGPGLSQTIITFRALKAVDYTEPLAIHQNMIYSTDIDHGCVNTVALHISKLEGEMPLIEVQIKHLRVLWLQRPCMTMIIFLKDNFADEMTAVLPPEYRHPDIKPVVVHPETLHRGKFRLSVVLELSECHLPASSVGTDGLAISLTEAVVYFKDPAMPEDYMRGPLLSSGKIKLDEIINVRKCLHALKTPLVMANYASATNSRKNPYTLRKNEAPLTWKLPLVAEMYLKAPLNSYFTERDRTKDFNLQADILDAQISSWCNRNIVGENIYLSADVHLEPSNLLDDNLFNEVNIKTGGDPDLPQMHSPRNTTIVDIKSHHVVDWTLAQGQYLLIVAMIQQNFTEILKGFNEKYPCAPLNTVHLQETLYGTSCLDTRLPYLSRVPIDIPCGRIKCIENKPEYYVLLGTQLPRKAPVVYLGTKTGFPKEEDTVPMTSLHYLHRRRRMLHMHAQKMSSLSHISHSHASTNVEGNILNAILPNLRVERMRAKLEMSKASMTGDHTHTSSVTSPEHDGSDRDDDNDENDTFKDDNAVDEEINGGTGQEVVLIIYFQHLWLDFTRRHYGGGNTIDVSARTFCICRDFTLTDPERACRYFTVDQSETKDSGGDSWEQKSSFRDDIAQTASAKKDSKTTSKEANSARLGTDHEAEWDFVDMETAAQQHSENASGYNVEAANADFLYIINNIPIESILLTSKVSTARSSAGGSSQFEVPEVPHITYNQEGVTNLRRCLVAINNSIVVAHMDLILNIVAFFVEPIQLFETRNIAYLAEQKHGPYDFKGMLDLEVVLTHCSVCLPESSKTDKSTIFTGARTGRKNSATSSSNKRAEQAAFSGMCLDLDKVIYTQAFRGFMKVGPGSGELKLALDVRKMYIDTFVNMHLVKDSDSLMEPFSVNFDMDVLILAPNDMAEDPDVLFPEGAPPPIPPSPHPENQVFHTGNDDHLLDEWIDFSQAFEKWSAQRRQYVQVRSSGKEQVGTGNRIFYRPHLLRKIRFTLEKIKPGQSSRSAKGRRVGLSPKDMAYSGGANASLEEAKWDPTLHMRLSVHDVKFILNVANQFTRSLKARAPRMPLEKRYDLLMASSADLVLLPMLTFFLVHVSVADRNLRMTKGSDVDARICDLNICLHNNTYNMHILEINLSNANLVYNHNLENLHGAAGVCLSIAAHSESMNTWEPVLEPVNINAIVANDISDSRTDSDLYRIRSNIFVEPMEFNASENTIIGLVRKIYLADFLTTSSTHLPPYMLINSMGVGMDFKIYYDGVASVTSSVPAGEEKPLEAKLLNARSANQATRAYADVRKNKSKGYDDDEDNNDDDIEYGIDGYAMQKSEKSRMDSEHLIMFSCVIGGVQYETTKPVPLDRDGFHTVELRSTGVISTPQENETRTGSNNNSDNEEDGSEDNNGNEENNDDDDDDSSRASAVSGKHSQNRSASASLSRKTQSAKFGTIRDTVTASLGFSSKLTQTQEKEAMKRVRNQPITVAINTRIKEDGGREISIGSVLSFRNQTNKPLEVKVENTLLKRSCISVILPGREWNCPVQLSYSSSSLHIRMVNASDWIVALPTFSSLVLGGTWDMPSRLRAELVTLPASGRSQSARGDAKNGDTSDHLPWLLVLRPIVSLLNRSETDTYVSVRMPIKQDTPVFENHSSWKPESNVVNSRNVCISLQAPMTLCNITSQPLLYRVADVDGIVFGEGTLLPGELADIHNLVSIFTKRVFVALRMANYCWSSWTQVMNRGVAYVSSEKTTTIALQSMHLLHHGEDLIMPTINIQMQIKDGFVHFYSSVIISNRTCMQLDLCEGSQKALYCPHSSRLGADTFLADALFQVEGEIGDSAQKIADLDTSKSREQRSRGDSIFKPNGQLYEQPADGRLSESKKSGNNDGGENMSAIAEHGAYIAASGSDSPKKQMTHVGSMSAASLSKKRIPQSPNYDADFVTPMADASIISRGAGLYTDEGGIALDMDGEEDSPQKQPTGNDAAGTARPVSWSSIGPSTSTSVNMNAGSQSQYLHNINSLQSTFANQLKAPPQIKEDELARMSIKCVIQLPFDHLQTTTVTLSADSTMKDLFSRMSSLVSIDPLHQKPASYEFFASTNGDFIFNAEQKEADTLSIARTVDFSPYAEGMSTSNLAAIGLISSSSAGDSNENLAESDVDAASNDSPSMSVKITRHHHKSVSNYLLALQREEFKQFNVMPPLLQPGMVAASFSRHLPMKMTLVEVLRKYGGEDLLNKFVAGKSNPSNSLKIQLNICLAHKAEVSIHEQLCKFQHKAPDSNARVTSWSGTNNQIPLLSHFKFPLLKVEGDILFHPARFMGLSPSLCMRIPHQTGWSETFDVRDTNFGNSGHSGVMHLSLTTEANSAQGYESSSFEFGAYLQKGAGLFSSVSIVSIVPKHMLVSKLGFPLMVRQIGTFRQFQELELAPNSVQPWHFPRKVEKNQQKLIQIKKMGDAAWSGEVDISNLGCVYARLRDPLVILKIEVELVGGSLVGTISAQSTEWPPFQIINKSSINIRYRQLHVVEAEKKNSGSFALYNKGKDHLPYDNLDPGERGGFAWDNPLTGVHVLEVDLKQGFHPRTGEIWVTENVSLEGIAAKPIEVVLKKPVLKPGTTLAEAWLNVLNVDEMAKRTGKVDGIWLPVYCLLTADVLYIFEDDTRVQLLEIINMSRAGAARGSIELARVTKYHNKAWDMVSALAGTSKDPTQTDKIQAPKLDPNKTRIFLLKVADALGLFDGTKVKKSRVRSMSDGNDSADGTKIDTDDQLAGGLIEAIELGASVDFLFDMLKTKRVTIDDILSTFRSSGAASSDESAIHLLEAFASQSLLRIYDGIERETYKGYKLGDTNRFTDVCILEPVLYPELLEMAQVAEEVFIQSQKANSRRDSHVEKVRAITCKDYGITIALGEFKCSFKCATEMEYMGWIQSCRQSIEQSWIQHMRDEDQIYKQIKLEHFNRNLFLKMRIHGPTKVLEIIERAEPSTLHNYVPSTGAWDDEKTAKSDIARAATRGQTTSVKLLVDASNKIKQIKKTELSISILLRSIGVSVIDKDCVEMFYFGMEEFDITIDKTSSSLRLAATIQKIQLANQLMPAMFQVSLFPRQYEQERVQKANANQRLMLPGLHQRGDQFPSLHFFFEKKLDIANDADTFQRSIENNGANADRKEGKQATSNKNKSEGKTNLVMYDMMTLWVAPLILHVEEEGIVRVARMFKNIKSRAKKDVYVAEARGRWYYRRKNVVAVPMIHGKIKNSIQVDKNVYETEAGYAELIARGYTSFANMSRAPYSAYDPTSYGITYYFTLLQMHPIDITLGFRPTSTFKSTSDELTWLGLVSQLDGTRVRLDALITEQASGTSIMFLSVLKKHYQFSILKQVHHIIGQSDIVEGSLGLVANLGTGVYHLFYEPIDGLMDSNGSFLNGLSKGGKSLVSRTFGGGAAQLSKVTGGVGTGMSFLTFDNEYKDKRHQGKLKKTTTVGEGVYVGAKELGSNLYDGVTGILSQPVRGYEEGGIGGAFAGVGRGIIGLAVKPMVGVFDLASRTTEGIRNTAFGSGTEEFQSVAVRTRLPRAFGRSDALLPYAIKPAAAQYLANKLAKCPKEPAIRVVYHLHIKRKVGISSLAGANATFKESANDPIEAWGFTADNHYIVLVCTNRIMLVQYTGVKNSKSPKVKANLIWTCPAHSIAQFYSDSCGDLIIAVNDHVKCVKNWDHSKPAVLDTRSHNYLQMQLILEKTVGAQLARYHPFHPPLSAYVNVAHKSYSSGVKSYFMKPKKGTYHLYGCLLYEFTQRSKNSQGDQANESQAADDTSAKSESATKEQASKNAVDAYEGMEDAVYTAILNNLFGKDDEDGTDIHSGSFLSYVYPLVDLRVTGPVLEKLPSNKMGYALTFARKDGKSMRCMKRELEDDPLQEHHKASVTIIYDTEPIANFWKNGIESSTIRQSADVWNGENAYVDEKQKRVIERSNRIDVDELIAATASNVQAMQQAMGEGQGKFFQFDWQLHSVVGKLVIPTSGMAPSDVERLKVEVGITLSNSREMF